MTKNEFVVRCFCGARMIPAGKGKYPYNCTAKDIHPNDMVYIGCENGHTGWIHESSAYLQIARFEFDHLSATGNYTGDDLTKWGFPYKPGEYIPVDQRYSALCSFEWAITARNMYNRQH